VRLGGWPQRALAGFDAWLSLRPCLVSLPLTSPHRRSSQAIDPAQDLREQRSGHCHLGQLEHHVTAVTHDPRADLDQLLAQGRQRQLCHLVRQHQRGQEVGEVVGERVELDSYRVVSEGVAGQPRPADGVLALLDPMLRRSAAVVNFTTRSLGRLRLVTMKPTRG
jgi:hypothetical protein